MKIIVSLETKQSIDLAHRIVDYVDGFKINHLLWDEIIACPRIAKVSQERIIR